MESEYSVEELVFIGVLSEQGATDVKVVKTEGETLFFVKGLSFNKIFEASGELLEVTDYDFETHSLDTEDGIKMFSELMSLGSTENA